MAIREVRSETHRIDVMREGETRRRVRLAASDSIPNRDFVLRYRPGGEGVRTSLLTQRGSDGRGYFSMMLVPPEDLRGMERAPVEFVFVLDCSGSMHGEPLKQAKDAVRRALDSMEESDTFQIIRFSNDASALGEGPLAATRSNVREGKRYLDSLDSSGGTEMIAGIRAALRFPTTGRTRYVTFLTDGYIGNEAQILGEMQREIGTSRVFSFGIGSSPNRFLMEQMARVGRGAVAYVGAGGDARKVMDLFFERVSHPGMTDLDFDWGALGSVEVYPERVPDLFLGRPVLITGTFTGDPNAIGRDPVRVRGRAGYSTRELTIAASASAPDRALEHVWARSKIGAITASAFRGDAHGEYREMIERVALTHGLMSAFTSFVAVDSLSSTAGEYGTTVGVPVPVPVGVEYRTTVQPGGG